MVLSLRPWFPDAFIRRLPMLGYILTDAAQYPAARAIDDFVVFVELRGC